MAENSNSPLKFVPIVGAAVSAGLSIFGAVKDNQEKKASAKTS